MNTLGKIDLEFTNGSTGKVQVNQPSSVELNRSTKGVYSWSIKVYFDLNSDESGKRAFEKLEKIDKYLENKYGSTNNSYSHSSQE